MISLAEAQIITDERLQHPYLHVVADDEFAEYPEAFSEQPLESGWVGEEACEYPGLYTVPDSDELEEPDVYLAREASHERFTQARFKRWLGSLSFRRTVEVKSTQESVDDTNLLEKIREAKAGSAEALGMVGINVSTAVTEACFKDRHVTEVTLEVGDDGELFQFGQSMLGVHANALTMRPGRHSILQEITHIEALNGHRIKDGLQAGVLDDHWLLVPSIVPNGVPEGDLGHKGDGYFLDSLTFVLQATTKQSTGEVITQSGFMAGVEADENASFEELISRRYDIRALARIYEQLGQEPPSTAAGFLDGGLYIPKSLMPNGVIDFMRWCDEATDELFGRDMERQPEEYAAIIEESKQREASLADVRQHVIDDLLAAADVLEAPMDAVRLMWELVKKYTVDASFSNTYIDPRVFGAEAAGYICQVRQDIKSGVDPALIEENKQRAQETAVVSGCGGGASSKSDSGGTQAGGEGNAAGGTEVLKCVTCPFCKKQVDAIVKHEKDAKVISCPKCKVSKRYKK